MTIPRYLGQVFKTMKQVKVQEAQKARYVSAQHSYTPSHRARNQELAWHAAVISAKESIAAAEAEDVLEGIAGSSGTTVDTANTKTKLNRSGSTAATNLPFTNGVSQKRELSTTTFYLRSAKQTSTFCKGAGRVSSDETMHTDTSCATGSQTTHTTSSSGNNLGSTREYSSKPEKTPEEKYLNDEEHRLKEGLMRGDNLMNQDEGMNPNEDKEGMRIHPVATHHHNNRGKRTGKKDGCSGTAGAAVASYSTSTKSKEAAHTDKHPADETREDRLMERERLEPESYEYTRSGTDGEVGDDAEAYCREHTKIGRAHV